MLFFSFPFFACQVFSTRNLHKYYRYVYHFFHGRGKEGNAMSLYFPTGPNEVHKNAHDVQIIAQIFFLV